jgi:hypothetical protein
MRYLLSCLFLALSVMGLSQSDQEPNVFVINCTEFGITAPLRDIVAETPDFDGVVKEINPIRHRKVINDDPNMVHPDPVLQTTAGTRMPLDFVANFDGTLNNEAGGYMPPDPSGAVGPEHYVQMVNVAMEIFDLEGNSLFGPTMLDNVFPNANNAGDPVVLYDEAADRWFISQFQFDNTIRIGISVTPDPLDEWYWYSFQFPGFPDYPKYSVWSDGYYVSSNMGGTNSAAFEREKMLAGDPTAQAVLLQLPNQGTNGFRTALPVDLEGADDPGRPAMIINVNDDAWGGQPDDHLRIWEWDIDWTNPGAADLEVLTTLEVADFDGVPSGFGFSNVDQPGNNESLDAILDGLMFPAKYRDFGSHASLVCCHAIQVPDNGSYQMRWYELRDEGDGWSIYQQGTYAPDATNRWMGAIGIDVVGNISMAYSVSDNDAVYPGLRFTGRYSSDPLGEMTLEEQVIVDGEGTQFGGNRWGDYAQMTVDPIDGLTFWFTGEYTRNSNGAWGTRIAGWQLQTPAAVDLGAIDILTPVDGSLTATEVVTVEVRNYGLEDQSNFDISYQVDGGPIVTEMYAGTLASGAIDQFEFVGTTDMSAFGSYDIVAWTSIADDGWEPNDATEKTVTHFFPQDVGVIDLTSPITDQLLTTDENVTVIIENFGSDDASNFPITYTVNGGPEIMEMVTGTVPAQGTLEFTFDQGADLETIGLYDFVVFTGLDGDFDSENDEYMEQVECLEPVYCVGDANCDDFDDSIKRVRLNQIDNPSECGPDGYTDFTQISTVLNMGSTYEFGGTAGYPDHFMSMWIDLNDNFGFEADEKFIASLSCPVENEEYFVEWTVPFGLPLGEHRMRVRTNWLEAPADACADQEWGETEDYTVSIDEGTSIITEMPFDLTITQSIDFNTAFINLNKEAGSYEVMLMDAAGRKIRWKQFQKGEGMHQEALDTRYLVTGAYIIVVSSDTYRTSEKILIQR